MTNRQRVSFVVRTAVILALVGAVVAGLRAVAGSESADADQARQAPADLVLRNGKIVTVDDAKPEAQALAARGDTIVAVGSNQEIHAYIGPSTKVIDLGGKLAIPGFIEGHGHFTGLGQSKLNLNLTKAKNWDAIVAMVADAATRARPGEWILGRGWHQDKWDKTPEPNVEGFPTHDALSRASPDNPVLLTHASGHATLANAKAMEISGITKDTPNPSGGEIIRDAAGNPIGAFRETASGLLRRRTEGTRTPEQVEADTRRVVELATEECLSKGITSFQDAGSSFATIDVFKKMTADGKLGVRLWVMARDSVDNLTRNLAAYRTVNMGDHRLTVRAIKASIDGALGSRGAWLHEPYADLPGSSGLNTTPLATLTDIARLAMQYDYQFCVHAIGDRGNRETLDIFEAAFKANPDKKDVRWRIEHSQHLSAADIPRFGQLGVIASMQGVHCTSDGPWVFARLGPQRAEEGAYVWQKLLKSGAVVTNGTDAPVEDVSPIESYYATVSRRMSNGQVFYGDQRMSRMEALKSYTLSAAYAAFEEGIKGSITSGKLADVTVLSKDITTVPDAEIPTAEVLYTIVGGKVMHSKAAPSSASR